MHARDDTPYGWRAKLGLIVPATNTVNESDWRRFAPEGVSFHTTRTPLRSPAQSAAEREDLIAEIASAAALLLSAKVDVISYACTADSMIVPPTEIADAISSAVKHTTITTAQALVDALTALGAKRISVATPYPDAADSLEQRFFSGMGFDVLGVKGLGISFTDHHAIPLVKSEVIFEHAIRSFHRGSDALVLTCTDFPTTGLIADLERAINAPVLTSNQATLWRALREAGVEDAIPALGRLFDPRQTTRDQSGPRSDGVAVSL